MLCSSYSSRRSVAAATGLLGGWRGRAWRAQARRSDDAFRRERRVAPALATAALAVLALAQGAAPAAAQLHIEDLTFLLYALNVDLTQVEIGRLAVEKAQDKKVRQFARRMVDYHQQSHDRLAPVARRNGIQPPNELDPVAQQWKAALERLSGSQLDPRYLAGEAITLYSARYAYRRERRHGRDEQLRREAGQQAADLEQHRRAIREITARSEIDPTQPHPEDSSFLLYALDIDKTQVVLSQLAFEKARDDRVQQYARRMLDFHGRSYDRLVQVARQKGVEPPQELAPVAQTMGAGLQQLRGSHFDWMYITAQVIYHNWAFYRYERESIHGRDASVRDLAILAVHDLQMHHDTALKVVREWRSPGH
jgi:predicted outer membrane protein